MMDILSYLSFQPVIHNWYNYAVCGSVHKKDPLPLVKKSNPCCGSSRIPLSLRICIYDSYMSSVAFTTFSHKS